jgi:hypothetical protein
MTDTSCLKCHIFTFIACYNIMSWLTVADYLRHKCPRLCSVYRVTSGTGTAYLSELSEFTPGF